MMVRFQIGTIDLSLVYNDQTGRETPQLPIQWVPGLLSLGTRRPGRDCLLPSNAELELSGAVPPVPHI